MELMIIAAVISIAGTIGVSNLLDIMKRYQLKEGTLEIANQLTLARMAAMNRNKTVTVSLAVSGGRVHLSSADSAGLTVTPDMEAMRHVTQVSGGPVTFNSLGMRTSGGSSTQQIAISTSSNQSYSVVIAANGKVVPCFKLICP